MNLFMSDIIFQKQQSVKQKILFIIIPFVVTCIQKIYGLTLRRVNLNPSFTLKLQKSKQAWIYSIWHTNVFFSPYLNRGQHVHVMISDSKDGEYIARVVKKFGNDTIRGSTSKGGIRALKQLVRVLSEGNPVAITPDGPRGPAFVVQPGIVTAGMMSGVPIIPFHYESTRQWIAEKAWDKHRVPKPFSTLVVSYGEPLYIDPNLTPDQFDEAVLKIQNAMIDNMQTCIRYVEELKNKKLIRED